MKTERRKIIKEMFLSKPFISLRELEKRFPDVTSMTLRRDIDYFEKQGELIKVRNGARSVKFLITSMEDDFKLREKANSDAKREIANLACTFVETGRSIFLDSGTTVMQLASAIPDEKLTITTTGPNVALALAKKDKPLINLVGGMVNRENISVSGYQAIDFLEGINIDIAFMAPSGYSAQGGFSCGNYSQCELKSYIVKKARKVIMLMDASKLDKSLPYTFCSLSEVDVIITDKPIDKNVIDEDRYPNLRIVVAGNNSQSREHSTKCLPFEIQ